jgi:hypothetical protein
MHREHFPRVLGLNQDDTPQIDLSVHSRSLNIVRAAAVAVTVVLMLTDACTAASMALTANITGTYDVSAPNSQVASGFLSDGQPHIYGVGIFAQVFDLQQGQSFGDVAFDITLGSALSRISATTANVSTNYLANNPAMDNVFDQNGTRIQNYFSGGDNADLGTSQSDLLGIMIDVDISTLGNTFDQNHTSTADPRQSMGVGAPFLLGSIFVRWDGTQNTQVTFGNAFYDLFLNRQVPPFSTPASIAPVEFVVSEPAGWFLLAAGAAALLVYRRRFFGRVCA